MRAVRLAAVLTVTAAILATASPALARPVDPQANNPEFWQGPGTTCSKVELTDGFGEWVLPALEDGTYATLVLKAATLNTVVTAPVAGVTYTPDNDRDISHVIVCVTDDGGDDDGDDGGEVDNT